METQFGEAKRSSAKPNAVRRSQSSDDPEITENKEKHGIDPVQSEQDRV